MSSQSSLTAMVAEYIVATTFEEIPKEAREQARRCIIDGIGVTLAGSRSKPARLIRQHINEMGCTNGQSTLVGVGSKSIAPFAALANGLAAHADDFDDTQVASRPDRAKALLTHPTSPVLASALAVAEEIEASGRELFTAFIVGQEVECKIAETIDPRHSMQGFHSTGTIGVFGAAAAVAKLLGVSRHQARCALGIAASTGAGIRTNFGTMTKSYHCGAAAKNGVVAARLASLGYIADESALDGPWGFFQVAGGGSDPLLLAGRLGNPYAVVSPGVSLKPYPCASVSHPTMDAFLDLIREHDVVPDRIQGVYVATTNKVLAPLRYTAPRNALEAKFSLQFCLANLAIERKAGLDQYTDENVCRPAMRKMMEKVKAYHDPALEEEGSDYLRSRVEIHLMNGNKISGYSGAARGTPQQPMTQDELSRKVRDCAYGTIPTAQTQRALDFVADLESQPSLSALIRALSPEATSKSTCSH